MLFRGSFQKETLMCRGPGLNRRPVEISPAYSLFFSVKNVGRGVNCMGLYVRWGISENHFS